MGVGELGRDLDFPDEALGPQAGREAGVESPEGLRFNEIVGYEDDTDELLYAAIAGAMAAQAPESSNCRRKVWR